ncbi:hypothetical protein BT69DRAFT_1320906 [Atractiella rhizophila]|nr:hypothetical protein BT69DRAFT_1320906 [Atractiella rhizophila]
MVETRTIVTLTSLLLGGSFIGYCVYFDHRRRHDTAFRQHLEKLHGSRTTGTGSAGVKSGSGGGKKPPTKAELEEAVKETRKANEEFQKSGVTPQGLERRFMEDIAIGEQLAQAGELLKAATSFYRATSFYPSPRDLLALYESSLPPEVFSLVMQMMQIDITMPQNASTTSTKPKKSTKTKGKKSPSSSSSVAEPVPADAILQEILSEESVSVSAPESNAAVEAKEGSRPSTPSSMASGEGNTTVVGASYVQVEVQPQE